MKRSLVLAACAAATLGAAAVAEADCGCAAWLVTDQVVEGKPYLVLAQGCVVDDPGPTLVLADARGTAIPTKLLTTHDGYQNTRQFVVTPERALVPGRYTVTHTGRYLKETSTLTVVAADPKATPPRWSSQTTRVLGQRQTELGCGPAKTVEVEAGAGATLAFVELTSGGERETGYVPVRDGKLGIGHGMCSGEFALVRGRRYRAQITLLAPAQGTSSGSRTVAFTYAP